MNSYPPGWGESDTRNYRTLKAAYLENRVLRVSIEAVRALHYPLYVSLDEVNYLEKCIECQKRWPCGTIKALEIKS